MPPDIAAAITGFLDRVGAALERDPDLRRSVADLARAVARHLDGGPAAPPTAEPPAAPPAPAPSPPVPPQLPDVTRPSGPSVHELATRLTFRGPAPTAPRPATGDELTLVPPAVLAARCRVKADAARVVAARLGGEPTDATAEGVDARAAALPDCPLWMLAADPVVRSPRVWADLAGAYETAAKAADLLAAWGPVADTRGADLTDRVLGLAAEAQSTLLYAVADVQAVRGDYEQIQLFARVREEGRVRRVYIPRFMRREDPADPANWPDVARRIDAALADVRAVTGRDRTRSKALDNLRFKTRRLAAGVADDDPDEWRRVVELTDEVVAAGLPPSSVELRECLLPLFGRLEERPELPSNVERVLRAVEAYRTQRATGAAAADGDRDRYTPEVAEAAGLLRGREAVLIGGLVRPDRRDALVEALGLAGLNWVSTPEHTSFTVFEAPISRPEAAVVLLATRWANHDYQNVREYCDRYGKPFVKLPAGYHPNQVAHQILAQAGDRLRAAPAG